MKERALSGAAVAAPEGGWGAAFAASMDKLIRELPGDLDRGVEGYRLFANQDLPDTAKDFAAHQAACKGALTHIELLLKLARLARGFCPEEGAASGAGEEGSAGGELARLIEEAREGLASLRDRSAGEDTGEWDGREGTP